MMQNVPTFDSMDRTLRCDHSLDFTVVLFVFQFYPVCNFGQFIKLELGTVGSERSNLHKKSEIYECHHTPKRQLTSTDYTIIKKFVIVRHVVNLILLGIYMYQNH